MKRLVLLSALILTASAFARVPSTKTAVLPNSGVRGNITVPYTTNGFTTLGVYNGVEPKVIASPILSSSQQPPFQNVYNLTFYGSKQGSAPGFISATPRPPNNLRGNNSK